MTIKVLNPVQDPVDQHYALAPRLETLSGKTLGLYSNLKLNATKLLDMIAGELAKDGDFKIQRGEYSMWNLMEPDAWSDIDRCDAVILANGDCGSCSSSGIANAVSLETRGIPTMLVTTPPFVAACTTMAVISGIKDLRWAVVEHPIGNATDEELRAKAVAAAAQFRSIILKERAAVAA
jgi:hypothetical protein